MADTEDAVVEDVDYDGEADGGDYVHPKRLVNETPMLLVSVFDNGLYILQTYGWFLLFGAIILYFLMSKLRQRYDIMKMRQEQDLHRFDNDAAYGRQEAMDAARRRLQDQFDQQAAEFAEKQKQKEDEKRKDRLEDWDRHVAGQGYRSKYRPPNENGSVAATLPGAGSSKKKSVYRQTDYNPLMGDGGGGASFRRPRGGGASGGG